MVTKEEVTKALLHDIAILFDVLRAAREEVRNSDRLFSIDVIWVIKEKTDEIEKCYQRPEVVKILHEMQAQKVFQVYPTLFRISGIEVEYFANQGKVMFLEDQTGLESGDVRERFWLSINSADSEQVSLTFGEENI